MNRPLNFFFSLATALSTVFALVGCQTQSPPPLQSARGPSIDLAITNAGVFGYSEATTIVVDNGRIVAVGTQTAKNVERTIDAKGAWVLPGFVDAHAHLLKGGLSVLNAVGIHNAVKSAGLYSAELQKLAVG